MTIIDHEAKDRVELFEKKMSLASGVISYSFTNISESSIFEQTILDIQAIDTLPSIYGYNGPYFMSELGINITDVTHSNYLSHVYSVELIKQNKNGEYLDSIWGGYSEFPSLKTDRILEKAKTFDDFKETKVGDYTIYSFRFVNEEDCTLYQPIYFYIDERSIVIGEFDDVKSVLLNKSETSLWEQKYNIKNTYHLTHIVDLQKYRTLTSGFIGSLDYDTALDNILSAEVKIEKGTDTIYTLTLNTGEESLTTETIYAELKKQLDDLANRLENAKQAEGRELAKILKSLLIEKESDHLTLKASVPNEILTFFYDNLISDIESFIMTFPSVLVDAGMDFSDDSDDREEEDSIIEDLASYKEKYYMWEFSSEATDDLYQALSPGLVSGTKKVWFVDKEEQQLGIALELINQIPSNLKWVGNYIDFMSPNLRSSSNEEISVDKNCGDFRTDDSTNLGENRSITRSILLDKNKTHRDIESISGNMLINFPTEISSKHFTREDVGKRVQLNHANFKLLELAKHSFSYMQSGLNDPILEIRALNKDGQALYINGNSKRSDQLPNGLKRKTMTHYVRGNIESLEVYYVDRFMRQPTGYRLPAEFRHPELLEHTSSKQISPVTLSEMEDRYFDNEKDHWNSIESSGYIKSRIESGKWDKIELNAPFEIYLSKDHGNSEVVLDFIILTPHEEIFQTSSTSMTLNINEVKLDDGTIHKRPTAEEKLEIENNRHFSFNGITSINWDIHPVFDEEDSYFHDREYALLGINQQNAKLKSFSGDVSLKLPEEINFVDIESIFVGDTIKGDGFEAKVIKFEDNKFYMRFINGGDKLVSVRAKNEYDETYRNLEPSFDHEGLVAFNRLGRNEICQFSYAKKMNIKKFKIDFDL